MHQHRHILSLGFVNELNGSWKMNTEILRPMISYGNLKIVNFSRVLKHIWQIGSYIKNVLLNTKTMNY